MNKRRLLRLAKLLESDASNEKGVKFDLSYWGGIDAIPHVERPRTVPVSCGTSACAIGLACISGIFKKEGFRAKILSKDDGGGNNIQPRYKGKTDFDAVEKFFGLTEVQALHLFALHNYWTKNLPVKGRDAELCVARRIREIVAA